MSAMYPCQGCGAALWEPIDGKWCLACHAIVTSLPLGTLTDEQVLSLDMAATVKRFAAELIDLHIATGIDLDFWPVAKRFIALAGRWGEDRTAADYADEPPHVPPAPPRAGGTTRADRSTTAT